MYVYAFVTVPAAVDGFVTVTFTAPAACAPLVAVMSDDERTLTLVADAPPSCTVAPPTNPDPLITSGVPPPVVPSVGVTSMTTGCGPFAVLMVTETCPVSAM